MILISVFLQNIRQHVPAIRRLTVAILQCKQFKCLCKQNSAAWLKDHFLLAVWSKEVFLLQNFAKTRKHPWCLSSWSCGSRGPPYGHSTSWVYTVLYINSLTICGGWLSWEVLESVVHLLNVSDHTWSQTIQIWRKHSTYRVSFSCCPLVLDFSLKTGASSPLAQCGLPGFPFSCEVSYCLEFTFILSERTKGKLSAASRAEIRCRKAKTPVSFYY